MPEYDNSGILFPNFMKKTERHPSHQGTATVNGVKYKVTAWEKQGTRSKFFSMRFEIPQEPAAEKAPAPENPAAFRPGQDPEPPKQNIDDDIPF